MKNAKVNIKVKKIVCGALASAMMLSMVACSSESDKNSKKHKKNDTDLVTEAAEDFTDALADMDFKKLVKFSTDLSDSTTEDAEKLYKTNTDVGDAMLKTVKFSIDEDSAKEDEDSGSVVVNYQYVDVQDLNPETLDEFIDQIKSTDEVKKGKITIKFEIEDDDALVSNADKAVAQFYDDVFDAAMKEIDFTSDGIVQIDSNGNIILDFDLDDFWEDDDDSFEQFGFGYYALTDEFEFAKNEDIVYVVYSYGENANVDRTATVCLNDIYDETVWTSKITIHGDLSEEEFTIKPSDLGLKEFAPDWYHLVITFDDVDYSFSTFVIVEDEINSNIDTVEIDVESDPVENKDNTDTTDATEVEKTTDSTSEVKPYEYMKTTEDKLGNIEGTSYTNEFFGFSLDVGDDVIVFDQDMIEQMGEAPQNLTYDEVAISKDGVKSVIILVADIDTSTTDSKNFILELQPGSGDSKATFNGVNFIEDASGTMFMTAKDNTVLILNFASSSVDMDYIQSVMNSIEEI